MTSVSSNPAPRAHSARPDALTGASGHPAAGARSTEGGASGDRSASGTTPLWFSRLAFGTAWLILAVGTASLALGAVGLLSPAALVPAAIALSACGIPLLVRLPDPGRQNRGAHLGATLALLVCIAAGVWASVDPSTPVLIDRDPGSYTTTAKWLSEGNSLWVREPLAAFGDNPVVEAQSAAVFEVGRDLEFQFMHLPAAFPAALATLGGDSLLFVANGWVAAAGLLALYAVAVRVTRKPLLSLVVPCGLALSLPWVAVARDVFSEPFAMLFLWTSVWLLHEVIARPSRLAMASAAGVFAGATALVRVDSFLYLAVLAVLGALWVVSGSDGERPARSKAFRAGGLAAAGVTLLALVDLFVASSTYARIINRNLTMLLVLLLGSAVASGLAVRHAATLKRIGARLVPLRRMVAWAGTALLAVTLLYLGVLRPATTPMDGTGLELRSQLWARSMHWMYWYLGGLTLALAVVAMLVGTYRAIRGTLLARYLPTLAILLAAGLLYWARPSILPDQIWATRRFIPAVMPGLLLAAAVALGLLLERVRSRQLRIGLAAAAVVAIVVPPALVTLRAPLPTRQGGAVEVVEGACDLLGEDSAVLVVGKKDRWTLPQTLRAWCGVPVANVADEEGVMSAAEVTRIASDVSRQGLELRVVSSDPDALEAALPQDWNVTASREVAFDRRLEVTHTEAPDSYQSEDVDNFDLLPLRYSLLVASPAAAR